jgi:hypothetical protein
MLEMMRKHREQQQSNINRSIESGTHTDIRLPPSGPLLSAQGKVSYK